MVSHSVAAIPAMMDSKTDLRIVPGTLWILDKLFFLSDVIGICSFVLTYLNLHLSIYLPTYLAFYLSI